MPNTKDTFSAVPYSPLNTVPPNPVTGETIADKYLHKLIDGADKTDVSLNFLLPLVTYKSEGYIQDVINHLEAYAARIPLDSELGKQLAHKQSE